MKQSYSSDSSSEDSDQSARKLNQRESRRRSDHSLSTGGQRARYHSLGEKTEEGQSQSKKSYVLCASLSAIVLILAIGGGVLLYAYRDKLFGSSTASTTSTAGSTPLSALASSSGTTLSSETRSSASSSISTGTGLTGSTSITTSPTSTANSAANDSTVPASAPSSKTNAVVDTTRFKISEIATSLVDPLQMYELKQECSGNFDCFDTSIDPLESGLAKINGKSITLSMDASQDLVPFGCGSESTIASQDVSSDDGAGFGLPFIDTNSRQSSVLMHSPAQNCIVAPESDVNGVIYEKQNDCSNGVFGCIVQSQSKDSWGKAWNEGGGGVFAFLYDPNGVHIWQFPRSNLPEQLDPPSPSTWGKPLAALIDSTCSRGSFVQQKFGLNLATCSSGATGISPSWTEECSTLAKTCGEYVAQGKNVKNMVWQIDSLRLYDVVESTLPE